MSARAFATTRPPPADTELYDVSLLEWLAMRRPYVWRGPIEDEVRAANDAETIVPPSKGD